MVPRLTTCSGYRTSGVLVRVPKTPLHVACVSREESVRARCRLRVPKTKWFRHAHPGPARTEIASLFGRRAAAFHLLLVRRIGVNMKVVEVTSSYGVTCVIRVAQLPSDARVPPQLPKGAEMYWLNVQVCAMYSEAIQMVLPSATAAP